jgi:serine/threonine-protein kinase
VVSETRLAPPRPVAKAEPEPPPPSDAGEDIDVDFEEAAASVRAAAAATERMPASSAAASPPAAPPPPGAPPPPRERISSPGRDPLSSSGANRAAGGRDPLAGSGANRAAGGRDPLGRSGANRAARDPLSVSGSNAAAAVEEPGPGTVIHGRYQLERVIGRGGMGSVWLARDLTLDIDVAMKLIRHDRTTPEARGRLLQEARAAARIGHPSIVRIFDFGETEGGDPFIVMELLDGEPLSGVLLRRQRLAPLVAVGTLLPVASALVAAHAKGIVHRDLKPDNILLVSNEAGALIPKLLDFGIALLLDSDPERRFTLAGDVLGSPDYMSPEQARGEVDVGAPTDIWAFSVMLYEAITGRRPFQGSNYNALILSIITNEPRPTMDLAAGDAELWAILQRGLTKQVSGRWTSMRDMGTAVAAWAADRGLSDDVAGNSLSSHWLAGGRRRTLSLHPYSAAVPDAPTLPARPSPAPAPSAPYTPEIETLTRPPFVSNRKPWIALLLISIAGVIGLLVYLAATESSDPTPDPAAPPSAAAAAPPPAPLPAETAKAPSTSAPTVAPRPAGPAPSPGGRGAPLPSVKPRATTTGPPPAPDKIKF